jgi:hypothetical protein
LSTSPSKGSERTYFNNPLIEDSLLLLPAAVDYPTSEAFYRYLVENLHHSGLETRKRFASYICHRFSESGGMNLSLARALKRFGDSRVGREILYFELLLAAPALREIASLWLSEQDDTGGSRASLNAFLAQRHPGKNVDWIAKAALTTFRRCNKIVPSSKPTYVPVWSEPPLDAFLYVLARLYPERTMVRVDLFAGLPLVRSLLWPRPCLAPLLDKARLAGHISKVSELDQYHQFTLSDAGPVRMSSLLGDSAPVVLFASESTATDGATSPSETVVGKSRIQGTTAKRPEMKPEGGSSTAKKATPKKKAKGGQKASSSQLPLLPKEE